MTELIRRAAEIRPAPRQLRYQRMEFIGFIHFTVNTFTDREWGDGSESPAIFAPTDCDPRQWAAIARESGMKMLILTTKHHDGFCLWPSAHTDHHIGHSPYRGGQGDLLAEFCQACREESIDPGFYLSPWDRHDRRYGSDAYNDYFKDQLRELLTNYGRIACMWFDGACAEGPNGRRQEYDWDGYYALIRELQPDCLITGVGPDVRWIGNEAGQGRASEWNVINIDKNWHAFNQENCTLEDLGSREALGDGAHLHWYPAEVDTSIRSGWFYHPHEDDEVKTVEQLVDIYYSSVGRGGTLLLNLPPDRRGLVHEIDRDHLLAMRRVLDQTFAIDRFAGAVASASASDGAHDAGAVLRDDQTWWQSGAGIEQAEIVIDCPQPITVNRFCLQEQISEGQRIEAFAIDAAVESADGAWKEIVVGTTVGYKRIERVPEVTARRFRLRIDASRWCPTLLRFASFRAGIEEHAPRLRRDATGAVHCSFPQHPDADLEVRIDDGDWQAYTGPIALSAGGLVGARAIEEGSTSQEARRRFGLCPDGWCILDASDDRAGAEHLIDQDAGTFWLAESGGLPQSVTIDTGSVREWQACSYLPRQDSHVGHIMAYAFAVSADGVDWQEVARGEFSNTVNNPLEQIVPFNAPISARYLRLTALGAYEGHRCASAAGLGVLLAR